MKLKKLFASIFLFATFNCFGQNGALLSSPNIDDASLYWIPTAAFSAINITTSAITINRLRHPERPDQYKKNAIFGVVSGAVQTALGVGNISATYKNAAIPSSLNIAIGATTIVTSIIRLARKAPPKETTMSYNFMYIPSVKNSHAIVGISLVRRFN